MHIFDSDSAKSPASYERWATALRQESLARRKSARLICGSDCSRWPSARAEDAESCGNHAGSIDSLTGAARNWPTPTTQDGKHATNSPGQEGRNGLVIQALNWQTPKARGDDWSPNAKPSNGGGHGLGAQVRKWQTPAVDSFRSRGGDRKHEQGLDQQARSWATPTAHLAPRGRNFTLSDGHTKPHDLTTQVRNWPTPDSVSSSAGARSRSPQELEAMRNGVQTGKYARQVTLQDAAALHCSRPDLTTSTDGASSSASSPKLNPLFVELLMGFPPGWTDCGVSVTESFRWWLRLHSARLRQLLQAASQTD